VKGGGINWNEFARLVSNEEAETVDYVVCMRDVPGEPHGPMAKYFGHCNRCLHAIYWAESAPKRPPKICVDCALEMGEEKHRKRKQKKTEPKPDATDAT
jgi:hypothetical protein